MDTDIKLFIRGGFTPKGTVRVSGAKNSALRLMAASLLTDENVYLSNFPTELVDVGHKISFIEKIGGHVSIDRENEFASFCAVDLNSRLLDDYFFPIRTTYLLAAGQLLRDGIARIPYPGGCNLGDRKYDLHIYVWEKMGCVVTEKENHIEIIGKKLTPAEINFPISTVGGTENALLMSSIVEGTTIIKNAYVTPEVQDLIRLLVAMGANIECNGNSLIRVSGKAGLRGASHNVISDRIEAITWLIYAAISGGNLVVKNTPFVDMKVPLIHLNEAGIDFYKNKNNTYLDGSCLFQGEIQPFEVACGTHPGVISDMQPFFVLLGLKADGISRIYDYRYPGRLAYLEQLAKLCPSSLVWESGKITVKGISKFVPGEVTSTDLRGSMALVLAGLVAEGVTIVNKGQMAMRGYNKLLEKIRHLGGDIEIVE